jgi:ribosome-binding ATPase YchF (GTP1/OBG family)
MITFTTESDAEQLEQLTAALTAAVSISDIEKAIAISQQRELLLKKIASNKSLDQNTKKTLSTLCKSILETEKPLIHSINIQKADIESKLKSQVNSNKAMSQYKQHNQQHR